MTKTFNKLFKEVHYICCVSNTDSIKYYLIQKYYDRVSMRLKAESEKIYNNGKNRFSELLSQEVKPCLLLKLIKPDTAWSGGLYHTPIPLGDSNAN